MNSIGILVYDSTLVGGAERVAIQMADEFSKNYKVHLITLFEKNHDNVVNKDNITTYTVMDSLCSITKNFSLITKRLRAYLKTNQIRVLYAITAGVVTVATRSARKTSTKVVYCEHSNLENKTYGKKHQLRQYIGAKCSDKVVTLTQRDRNNFIKFYHLPEEKVVSIPNWFTPAHQGDTSYDVNAKGIITAGRLEYVKGYDNLLKVAKLVQQKHPEWCWHIYGEGTLHEEIQHSICEMGLETFVQLKGNVSDLPNRMVNYGIFVLTSYFEGLPLVLLEAQVGRLPIVSFDCPTGPAEIIDDRVNGILIPTYNIEKMAQAICNLIENDKLRKEFSEKAQIGLNRFSKEEIIKKWNSLTNELM